MKRQDCYNELAQILVFFERHKSGSTEKISQVTGLSIRKVRSCLKILRARNLVEWNTDWYDQHSYRRIYRRVKKYED